MANSVTMNADSGQKTWLTPLTIIDALGEFDLDPCTPENMPWRTAKRMVTEEEDGLKVDWSGNRVWLNPPYGRESIPFLKKMAKHKDNGGGIAFIFGRTDTKVWHEWVFPFADSLLFVAGRVKFYNGDGTIGAAAANAPSVLVAYTKRDTEFLKKSGIYGALLVPYYRANVG